METGEEGWERDSVTNASSVGIVTKLWGDDAGGGWQTKDEDEEELALVSLLRDVDG